MKKLFTHSVIIVSFVFLLSNFQVKAQALSNTSPGIPTATPQLKWLYLFPGGVEKIEYYQNYIYAAGNYGYSTANNNFQIGSNYVTHVGGTDIFFGKWDTLGNLIWIKTIADTANERIVGLKIANNSLYIAGNFTDASLQIGANNFNTFGLQDAFIAQFDTNGNFLNANHYGTVVADTLKDFCIDYLGNQYLTTNHQLIKYSNVGNPVWQINVTGKINNLFYSALDTTILLTGGFGDSIRIASATIYNNSSSIGMPNGMPYYKVFCSKIDLNANCLWLKKISDSTSSNTWEEVLDAVTMQPSNGKLYLVSCHNNLMPPSEIVFEIDPNGTYSEVVKFGLYTSPYYLLPRAKTISISDTLLAIVFSTEYVFPTNPYKGIVWINVNTGQKVHLDGGNWGKAFLVTPSKAIYNGSTIDTNSVGQFGVFGKWTHDWLQVDPSQSNMIACGPGTTHQMYGIINSGNPPYTYSWSPSTGLSASNTDTVQFVLNNSITYTLTVTDAIGDTATALFHTRIDSSMVAPAITAQFPYFCGGIDSIVLHSNIGEPVYWYRYNSSGYWTYLSNADSIVITSAGMYKYFRYNACVPNFGDTIVIATHVTSSYSTLTISCNSLPYFWNGQWLTHQGYYSTTLINSVGCDSIVSFMLILLNSPTSTVNVTACNSYTWPLNGLTYTQSGNYADTLQNAAGCDSITILHLQLWNQSMQNAVTACNSYTWSVNGVTYSNSGVYTITLQNAQGCDSILTLNLSLHESTSSSQLINSCSTFYVWPLNGNLYSTSGIYTLTFTNINGCDSVITLQLSLFTSSSSTQNIIACDTYTWLANATTYTNSGTYQATLQNSVGCDSVITLQLSLFSSSSSTQNITACDTYTWLANATTYTSSGTYQATLQNSAGCDSLITLQLSLFSSSSSTQNIIACDTYTWLANATTYTSSGTYQTTLQNSVGCDSVITVMLLIPFTNQNLALTRNDDTLFTTVPAITYQWIDCNTNTMISGATSSSYVPMVAGSYAIQFDTPPCTDTSFCFQFIPMNFNGVDPDSQIYIYPNPSIGIFSIRLNEDAEIRITNPLGEIVLYQYFTSGWHNIDLSAQANGVYFVDVRHKQNHRVFQISKHK